MYLYLAMTFSTDSPKTWRRNFFGLVGCWSRNGWIVILISRSYQILGSKELLVTRRPFGLTPRQVSENVCFSGRNVWTGSADTEGSSGRRLGMLAGGTLLGHWAPATKFKERWAEMVGSTKNEWRTTPLCLVMERLTYNAHIEFGETFYQSRMKTHQHA